MSEFLHHLFWTALLIVPAILAVPLYRGSWRRSLLFVVPWAILVTLLQYWWRGGF